MCPAPWNNDPLPAHLLLSKLEPETQENHDTAESSDVSVPTREHPLSHPTVDAPICVECQALELTFFDPGCQGCRRELQAKPSSQNGIAHVFAVLRQWVPQVQQSVDFLVGEALRRGAHPDDRDSLTDMTLLMYAAKAGANGVGKIEKAVAVTRSLLSLGADLGLRCKWTDMSALHYAAFFDAAPVLKELLMKSKGTDVDTTCNEYEDGSALHIAAANLSVGAAKILMSFGADTELRDNLARSPIDCVPEPEDFLIPDAGELVEAMASILLRGGIKEDNNNGSTKRPYGEASTKAISGRTVLKALGLKVGDRVVVNGNKMGSLRFCGTTDFAPGVWAGVEYDDEDGKNDGSVKGVVYFRCEKNHGVFVLASKVAKIGKNYKDSSAASASEKPSPRQTVVNRGKVDVSHVSSRLTECLAVIEEKQEIKVGDRVRVNIPDPNKRAKEASAEEEGTVRFVGKVDFTRDDDEAKWFGVELDRPRGRHEGTVQGVRYFAAAPNSGVFVTEAKIAKIVSTEAVRMNRSLSRESFKTVAQSFSSSYQNIGDEDGGLTDKTILGGISRTSLSTKHRVSKASSNSCNSISSAAEQRQQGPGPKQQQHAGSSDGPSSIVSRISSSRNNNAPKVAENNSGGSSSWQTVAAVEFNRFKKKVPKKYLEVGTSVICIHNKEMGVVKFVGRVDFAQGIWTGLELRSPKGRHDGTVEGKKYFTCKSGHGIMIRPKMISVHGINGEKLLKNDSEYPF